MIADLRTALEHAGIAATDDQLESLSSMMSSPSPPTSPTPTSDTLTTVISTVMMTFREMMEFQAKETREMVLDILQGRQIPMSRQVTTLIEPEQQRNSDDDWTGLPPEIIAVRDRENEETLELARVHRLQMERASLQQRLSSLASELNPEQTWEAYQNRPSVEYTSLDSNGSDGKTGESTT